jgi:hypothetical protein
LLTASLALLYGFGDLWVYFVQYWNFKFDILRISPWQLPKGLPTLEPTNTKTAADMITTHDFTRLHFYSQKLTEVTRNYERPSCDDRKDLRSVTVVGTSQNWVLNLYWICNCIGIFKWLLPNCIYFQIIYFNFEKWPLFK